MKAKMLLIEPEMNMMKGINLMFRILCFVLAAVFACLPAGVFAGKAGETQPPANPYTEWRQGPPHGPDFFPIAVWIQSPKNASLYKEAGINLYVGLWKGPTVEQLEELKKHNMPVICSQNKVGMEYINDPIIIGWMHGDEPDNAQSITTGEKKEWGPPVPPAEIVDDYKKIVATDPSRPVFLNLGQGVAWDGWYGRGVRTGHPEDYPEYVKGCDIASFDIYPAVHSNPEVAGNLSFVGRGVKRLRQWTEGKKPVWNCIECTQINNPAKKPTPHEVRCEVWMSLIYGSMGLVYFVHEWQPKFNEAALLDDPEMLAAVTAINKRIANLAPVLNSPTIENEVTVAVDNPGAPVAVMMKRHNEVTYLFAVCTEREKTRATFTLQGIEGSVAVEVLDEGHKLDAVDGVFADEFEPYDVHLYRIKGQ